MAFDLHPGSTRFAEVSPGLPVVAIDGWLEDPQTPDAGVGDDLVTKRENILRQVWQRSPDGAFRRLRGRFAAVVVDPRAWRLVAYRSPIAGPALFYHLHRRRLILASEPWPLLALDVGGEPDDAWLSHYFHLRTLPDNRCAFARLRELLPGERLDCTQDSWRLKRDLPVFDRVDEARYRDDAACAARFRDLLSRAVARSTGGRPFGIMQSSGVDSSSLAAVVARDEALRGRLLATYSWSLEDFPDADEGAQIRLLTGHLGLPNRVVAGESCWPPAAPSEWPLCPNTPVSNPFRVLKARLYERARRDGCPQLLNGNAGDLLYPGGGHLLLDALRHRRAGLLVSELVRIVRRRGVGGLTASPALRGLAGGLLRRQPRVAVPSHLTTCASGHIDSDGRWPSEAAHQARPGHYESLLGLNFARSVDGEGYFINAHGMDWVEPYLDQDLVGFMLGIPTWQCYREGMDKRVAREAMRGILPESVRTQPRVGLLGDIFRAGFYRSMPWITGLLWAPGAEWPRYVRRDYVEGALSKSTMSDGEMMHLWQCAAFEMWLDRYFR